MHGGCQLVHCCGAGGAIHRLCVTCLGRCFLTWTFAGGVLPACWPDCAGEGDGKASDMAAMAAKAALRSANPELGISLSVSASDSSLAP
jgi:hypothetical protein